MAEGFSYTGKEELDQARFLPRYNRHIANLFLKVIKPGATLLDFGAGIGTISALVREESRAQNILCVEIDAENIAALKAKNFEILTDAAQCADASIDVIYSSNVLEHIEDDMAVLKTLHAKLKPGGRAAFWVPAFECLWTPMDDRVEHCRRYTKDSMTKVFQNAGFTVENCFYQDSLGFFVTLLFKYIGSGDGTVSNTALKIYDSVIFPLSRLCDCVFSRFFGKNVVIYARKG